MFLGAAPPTLAYQNDNNVNVKGIVALSFEEVIVFAISNQSRSSGSWGLRPQTPAGLPMIRIISIST